MRISDQNFAGSGRQVLNWIGIVSLAFVFLSLDSSVMVAQPPAGLPKLRVPKDNPMTPEKIELGKMLYFETRLSQDNTISCASCHDPKKGYSDGSSVSTGFGSQKGGRNAPTVINAAYQRFQFWDGRARSLEEQAFGPIQNPIEMNMKLEDALARINKIPGYQKRFQEVFGGPATDERVAQAIAAFERTILSGDAPYDRFSAGDKSALSESAQRGMDLFFGRANCTACHSTPHFSDRAFHNIGVGQDKPNPDPGRFAISKLEGDTGAFKTPTLREIARSAPYMHDGSIATLQEVVAFYNRGGVPNDYLDEELFPLNLTAAEQKDLVQFLKEGLSSDSYPEVAPPQLPE